MIRNRFPALDKTFEELDSEGLQEPVDNQTNATNAKGVSECTANPLKKKGIASCRQRCGNEVS